MTISQIFIEEKINLLAGYLKTASGIFDISDDNLIIKSNDIYVLERMFQLGVEVIIDINNYFIKELNIEPALDIQSSFKTLADNNILPKEFADKIAPVVGLRNKLVHVYEKLDKSSFVHDFRKNIDDFNLYNAYILKYVKKDQ